MADHPVFAAVYDRLMARSERAGLARRRATLLAEARGRVLEIGAGTGLNLPHYRSGQVTSLTALEPDGPIRRHLARRAAVAPVPVDIVAAAVETADLPEGGFDTVVSTLALCSVDDVDVAVAAMVRWLAPSGNLLYLEHTRAGGPAGWAQRAAQPVWQRLAAGCQLRRDPVSVMWRSGLVVEECERFALPAGGPLLSSCVQGRARRRRTAAEVAGPPEAEVAGPPAAEVAGQPLVEVAGPPAVEVAGPPAGGGTEVDR